MQKRILVTGAGGFIGGFIVEEALQRGYETWAGIRPSTSRAYLTDGRIRFINLSFGNKDELKQQLLLQLPRSASGILSFTIWALPSVKMWTILKK